MARTACQLSPDWNPATPALTVMRVVPTPPVTGMAATALRSRSAIRTAAASSVSGEDDGELVAAEPAEDVAVAEAFAQDVGERAHDAVAGRVAAEVVDVLEVVEVEQQQRAVAAECELAFELPGEGAAVEQAGQRVLVGHADEGFLPFVTFGGVNAAFPPSGDVHHPIEVAVVERVAADLEPAVLVLPRPQRQHEARRAGLPGRRRAGRAAIGRRTVRGRVPAGQP